MRIQCQNDAEVSSDWGEIIFTFQRTRFGLVFVFDINQLNKC